MSIPTGLAQAAHATRAPRAALLLLLAAGTALADGGGAARTVAAGSSWLVEQTTALPGLVIGEGATLAAPAGKSLTLTVDGVETPIAPGRYAGKVVLSVTDTYEVKFSAMGGGAVHPFRQAIYLDAHGVVADKSVRAAAGAYTRQGNVLAGATIRSRAENFNGVVATGGTHVVKGLKVDFEGNGGNDFAGYGAALFSTGKGTTLVVDGAKVHTHGAIRTAAVADGSSHLVVKNSELVARNGVLPAGYRSNVSPGDMKDAPWMLGIVGNVRTTNLLGEGTLATYVNSRIASEEWGVLSVDNGSNTRLTTIDSEVSNTGRSGYGSYAIGNSTNAFYGTRFHVATYAQIITGGNVVYAASTPATVAKLNDELQLGLDAAELKALPARQTEIHSKRFGLMWHGQGSVTVRDGTTIDTALTTFLVKGAVAKIDVDGSRGAKLHAGNGVLVQVIDNDDPGPGNDHGMMVNNGVYHEPTTPAAKAADFDVAARHDSDVVARFAAITLAGDLYNGIRGGKAAGPSPGEAFVPNGEGFGGAPGGPGGGAPGAPGGAGPGGGPGGGAPMMMPARAPGTNLVVELVEGTHLTGAISASTPHHAQDSIGAADFELLGVVANTRSPAINNGVIVSLAKSTWTVTANSYLTALSLDAASSIEAPPGRTLVLSVDGKEQPLRPGAYQGAIVLALR